MVQSMKNPQCTVLALLNFTKRMTSIIRWGPWLVHPSHRLYNKNATKRNGKNSKHCINNNNASSKTISWCLFQSESSR